MALKRYAGDKIVGLSTDTKPTNVPDGATFYETDTLEFYVLTSGSWELLKPIPGNNKEIFYNNNGALAGATGFVYDSSTNKVLIDGELLIGYTADNGAYPLQVNGQIFATNATIATSDKHYKQNIKSLEKGLELVEKLNPVEFNWKTHPVHEFDIENKHVGFIAQEVEEVLKNEEYLTSIVKENTITYRNEHNEKVEETFLGLSEIALISILTKAIQELNEKVESLEQKINN